MTEKSKFNLENAARELKAQGRSFCVGMYSGVMLKTNRAESLYWAEQGGHFFVSKTFRGLICQICTVENGNIRRDLNLGADEDAA